MILVRKNSKLFHKLVQRGAHTKKRITKVVSKILEDVRSKKDEAVVHYTRKFDRVRIAPKNIRVSEAEISGAFNELNSGIIYALKGIIENVTAFYKKQLPRSCRIRLAEGKTLEERFLPLEKVGVYIPSGQAPLVSSVYMCVIPALVAGVKEVVLASPPNQQGYINPYILAVASMLKIKNIYKIGGAQAIAALAYGTETVSKVDKIVGPGNEYVTEAKRQVFGVVAIDMLAGPSEVVIVAGRKSSAPYIIKDLEAQTEHRNGIGVVITPCKFLARELKAVNTNAYLIVVKNLNEALDVVNKIAPEHLEIMIKQSSKFIRKVKHAAAIFVGDYTPVALGDYSAGPSHVLPTAGTARFSSGLSVHDFLKRTHIVNYSKKALMNEKDSLEKIATLEGMKKHLESVQIRLV